MIKKVEYNKDLVTIYYDNKKIDIYKDMKDFDYFSKLYMLSYLSNTESGLDGPEKYKKLLNNFIIKQERKEKLIKLNAIDN